MYIRYEDNVKIVHRGVNSAYIVISWLHSTDTYLFPAEGIILNQKSA